MNKHLFKLFLSGAGFAFAAYAGAGSGLAVVAAIAVLAVPLGYVAGMIIDQHRARGSDTEVGPDQRGFGWDDDEDEDQDSNSLSMASHGYNPQRPGIGKGY